MTGEPVHFLNVSEKKHAFAIEKKTCCIPGRIRIFHASRFASHAQHIIIKASGFTVPFYFRSVKLP